MLVREGTYMVCWKVADVTSVVEVFLCLVLVVCGVTVAVEHTVGVYGLVVV